MGNAAILVITVFAVQKKEDIKTELVQLAGCLQSLVRD
jgi:hypothetical protein